MYGPGEDAVPFLGSPGLCRSSVQAPWYAHIYSFFLCDANRVVELEIDRYEYGESGMSRMIRLNDPTSELLNINHAIDNRACGHSEHHISNTFTWLHMRQSQQEVLQYVASVEEWTVPQLKPFSI